MKILKIPFAKVLWFWMVKHYPKFCCKLLYRKATGKKLNLNNPQDLNEKIQWLKFHENQDVWARLADKYAVREYVKERGLEHILIKLYGKYDNVEELLSDWDNLPNKFVLKSNNGCGTIKLIKDKSVIDTNILKEEIRYWLSQNDIGLGTVELHYTRIKPCIIAEELLEDTSVSSYSCGIIDYKIWCFNGNPFCCVVMYDRNLDKHNKPQFDMYDLDWKPMRNCITHAEDRKYKLLCPKPKNWETMLEYAHVLSEGHPQVRMDFYNIDGKIYFGEMTFTARGGFQDNYTDEILLEMGQKVNLERFIKTR